MKKFAWASISALLLIVFSVAPASATPTALPDGDNLYAFEWDAYPGLVWHVTDPTTGESVAPVLNFDDLNLDLDRAYGGAYDPTTGLVWTVGMLGDGSSVMIYFDPTTNTLDYVELTGELDTDGDRPWQVAINREGDAWILSNNTSSLYSVDLITGATTQVGSSAVDTSGGFLSYDPATDEIILVNNSGDIYSVHALNPETLELTLKYDFDRTAVPSVSAPDGGSTGNYPDALAIDSDGNYWWQMDNGFSSDIAVYSPATDSWTVNGWLFDSSNDYYAADRFHGTSAFYAMAYVIAYRVDSAKEELADTGVDSNVGAALFGAGFSAMAIGVLIARRRVRA